ncbi:MAG: hypothetical protein HDT28_01920 [Clostridiales bacterium]|nr:hypothetical protein [Clostridiales bacterium]
MNFHILDLGDELDRRIFESYECFNNTADYLPIDYANKIRANIFNDYKKIRKILIKENKKYQKNLKPLSRLANFFFNLFKPKLVIQSIQLPVPSEFSPDILNANPLVTDKPVEEPGSTNGINDQS